MKVKDELYTEVMSFAQKATGAASDAARKFAEKLEQSRDNFSTQCVKYLTVDAETFQNEVGGEVFKRFLAACRERGEHAVVSRLVDIATSKYFGCEYEALAHLAIALGGCGYENESLRCFNVATQLVPKSE